MQHIQLSDHGREGRRAAHTALRPWERRGGGRVPHHTTMVPRVFIQRYVRVSSLLPWVDLMVHPAAPRSCIYGTLV